ncbi:MAG: DUF2161 family putative PD-(D/E)XK-type phosphodiesterase [Clostridiales bacterium]|jgi:hypothetical protein|nr:DUF2161 family putative PD-(D/E)XK-type phosphodiesterase [Clostridiales bacterium]
MEFRESDMYAPLARFFEGRGWSVRGETEGVDLAAEKDGLIAAVEMKRGMSLALVYQAIDRQAIADEVYVAVGRFASMRDGAARGAVSLLKRLGVGLITVAMDSPLKTVEIIVAPADPREPRRNARRGSRLKKEIAGRSSDRNVGGTNSGIIITAYREGAIRAAAALAAFGDMSARELRERFGCPDNTYAILYNNPYGWFERVGRGVYALTGAGRTAVASERFAPIAREFAELFGKE